MDRLIHTPEGVRDVYNQECTKKLYLENQIEQVFHAFGYQDIETPTFEFFDVFGREVGTTPSRELYKFFDRDGNTLVLRPDFTPVDCTRSLHVFHGRDDADPPLLQRKQLRQQQQLSGPLKRVHPDGCRALKR